MTTQLDKQHLTEYMAVVLTVMGNTPGYQEDLDIPESERYAFEALYEMLGKALGKE